MKKLTKILTLALAGAIVSASALAFASCGSDKKTVAIMKFGSFGSLNDCEEGILKGLAEQGINKDEYKIEQYDSNFDSSIATSQAQTLVNKGVDVIVSIATPCAVAAANASNGDVPVVYCAVTDDNNMNAYTNVCGTSDIPDYDLTLKMVTTVMGKEDLTIGVLRYVNEGSDAAMVDAMKTAAEAYTDMSIVDYTINDMTTLSSVVANQTQTVDCFVNILDSTIVGELQTILEESTVPVFGSEIQQVKEGCIASVSYDYVEQVGKVAGEMAAKILKGEKKTADLGKVRFKMPEYTPALYYNPTIVSEYDLTGNIPETIEGIIVQSTQSLA